MSKTILVTGASSFIGKHVQLLYENDSDIKLLKATRDELFDLQIISKLTDAADCVIHLAGASRVTEDQKLIEINEAINSQLMSALEKKGNATHVIISGSIHDARDSEYGQSKRLTAEQFEELEKNNQQIKVSNLRLPNLFGPYAKVGYVSVIANFCDALARGEEPVVIQDNEIGFLYIEDLMRALEQIVDLPLYGSISFSTTNIKVSRFLSLLVELSAAKATTPLADTSFKSNLLQTYKYYEKIAQQQPDLD